MSDRRRDGTKLSFSDLDKLRRERKHGGSPQERDTRQGSTHAQKSYRAALERAFDAGKLAEFAATMQRSREPLASAPRSGSGPVAPTSGDARAAQGDAGHGDAGEERVAAAGNPAGTEGAAGTAAGAPVQAPAVEPAAPPLASRSNERAEQRRLGKKITEATDPRELARAVDRYLARFDDLPGDYELLEKVLSHPRAAVVLRALEVIESQLARQKPRRSRSLSVQLTILEETHEDSDVRELAARVRAAL